MIFTPELWLGACEMLLRSVLSLGIGVVAIPRPASAADFDILSSVRVAAITSRSADDGKTERRPRHAPILVPPTDLASADSFREDELRIWSSTTGTIWHLLPPKFLGVGVPLDVGEGK